MASIGQAQVSIVTRRVPAVSDRRDHPARLLATALLGGSIALGAVTVCYGAEAVPARGVAVTKAPDAVDAPAGAAITAFAGSTTGADRTATLTLTGGGPGCRLETAGFNDLPVAPPPGVSFPDGVLDVVAVGCVPASTLQFTLTLSTPLPPGAKYWKYGRTSDDRSPHWYEIPSIISGKAVTYGISDGGLGDDDLTVNGAISGPGGIGIGSVSTPVAPESVTALAGNDHVSLRWSATPSATGYTIKRATKSGGPYISVAVNQSGTVYLDKTGVNGTMYYYTVSATNSEGESGSSPEVRAAPLAAKVPTACGVEPRTFPRNIPCPPLRAGTIIEEEVYVCNGTQWQSTGWRVKESNCVAVDSGSAPPTEY